MGEDSSVAAHLAGKEEQAPDCSTDSAGVYRVYQWQCWLQQLPQQAAWVAELLGVAHLPQWGRGQRLGCIGSGATWQCAWQGGPTDISQPAVAGFADRTWPLTLAAQAGAPGPGRGYEPVLWLRIWARGRGRPECELPSRLESRTPYPSVWLPGQPLGQALPYPVTQLKV